MLDILRFFRWLIVAWAIGITAPVSAQLLSAEDLTQLAATARTQRAPLLIHFMEHSCPYCAIARRDYLIPLQNDPKWRGRVLIREIDVSRSTALRDFDGMTTTHRSFARSHGVRRVPTLIAFDAEGKPVAPPIVGLLADDFYRLYIEQALEAGLVKMRPRKP